ncbi:KAP family P-loop NTPase fold protein [Aliarcobacter butzleri]|uniref:KAP family P-loop NTPase fold protein n=1 Tax=Aliarcobacter butzleri TaxID=28197 RepID=UPI001EDAAF7B|nr:P-loop NTPase fold protein [Aliarcobacter butzleri]MCG3671953.1 KAP family NTPase [Aliarcobacter butzleri]
MKKNNFTFKSDSKDFIDKLGREDIAKLYVKFINDLDGHHVIALDAPWGSGKSTLIDYMCEEFENKNDVFVKYNAWENDYTEEPLISLMNDLFEKFEAKKYIGKDNCKNLVSNIVKATKLTTKGTLKGLSKIAIGEEATKNLSDACLAIAGTVTEEIADNLFKDINESKKSRKKFKDELKNYTNKILEEKSKDRLIIIIDELDRCRPTFAIELLENIKHLFDIENIVFLIAVDCKQLAESIKAVYGNGFDANTYLHRFFDFELHLKRDSIGTYFTERISEKLNTNFINTEEFAQDSVKTFNLSIRDINKIINETSIIDRLLKQSKEPVLLKKDICLILLIIKYKNPELYKYLRESKGNLQDNNLIDKINQKTTIRLFMVNHLGFRENAIGYNYEEIEKTIKIIEETL